MRRRLKQAGLVLVIIFAAAQFIQPDRATPADASHTVQAQLGTETELAAVVTRACGDCHSNGTVWPWYTHVAPVSWVMAASVKKGRAIVDFSQWASYPPARQQELLVMSCKSVTKGTMPGRAWTTLHPETRLSTEDIETICVAADETGRTP
jgi:hypothetical protein